MGVKNVLLFTGKFPSFGNDLDGGSLTVNGIINALRGHCRLDIAFTRTPTNEFTSLDGVDDIHFETYRFCSADKFERRLKNKAQLLDYLQDNASHYDRLIITHCSKAFGLNTLPESERKKTVLFPMYLSPSYKRSGEIPPEEYVREEYLALNAVGKIITPSPSEKQDIIDFYNVPENKITVIPRGFSECIKPNIKPISEPVRLLYIASIKEQKNNVEAIIFVNELRGCGINAELHLVGGAQDLNVYNDCRKYVAANNLERFVKFHGVVSQEQLAELISQVHINISTSNWETYGRGVFEGMAGALPTVVYDRLDCVAQYVSNGNGIIFVKTHKEFINALRTLIECGDYYMAQATRASEAVKDLSTTRENLRLIKELL